MEDLFTLIHRLRQQGTAAAVATVVQVTGSAYRREGAWMVITAAGDTYGTISGGCLESDVMEAAQEVMVTGEARLLQYDNTANDDMVWGLALGCNGIVEVLVEPAAGTPATGAADRTGFDLYGELGALQQSRTPAVVVTVLESMDPRVATLSRRLVYDGGTRGGLGAPELDEAVTAAAAALLCGGRSQTQAYRLGPPVQHLPLTACVPGGVRLFLDPVLPPPRLVVFGAGHDAVPVVAMARHLGFDLCVIDNRPRYATPLRFPAAQCVLCATLEEARSQISLDNDTYVLVMTHHFPRDVEIVGWVIHRPVRYIGLLGPKDRAEKLLAALADKGVRLTAEQLDRLYAPVGLEIGGETPEEIAASILAEIQSVRYRRSGAHLRDRSGPIHVL